MASDVKRKESRWKVVEQGHANLFVIMDPYDRKWLMSGQMNGELHTVEQRRILNLVEDAVNENNEPAEDDMKKAEELIKCKNHRIRKIAALLRKERKHGESQLRQHLSSGSEALHQRNELVDLLREFLAKSRTEPDLFFRASELVSHYEKKRDRL